MTMATSSATNALYLALRLVPRLANDIKLRLIDEYGLPQIFQLSEQQLTTIGLNDKQRRALLEPNWAYIDHVLNLALQHNMQVVSIDQPHYPRLLKQITNPPLCLFVQGNLTLLNMPQLAIVGSRNASLAAREHAKYFAMQLSDYAVITSGLALGIDGCAHAGALRGHGMTIAVVATGLDMVYPTRHKILAQQILDNNGAIVSECLPKAPPHPGAFPRRNRIISGMSCGVFVVEAAIKSGSLISAKLALEQNREVFAMPGNINNPNTRGCHSLIKQGAHLVDSRDDIIGALNLSLLADISSNIETNLVAKSSQKKLQKSEQQDLFIDPLLRTVDYETTAVDTVVSRSKLPIEEVLTRLMTLELRGLVAAVPGGYIKLKN
ncbi:DNA-processing protein DprA [Thalassotalea maritima]|uniref:DNA-processing protein DprA n=1 Tax=Thalassotalea maritima TaxID=3242416 RepID=UPI00352860FC